MERGRDRQVERVRDRKNNLQPTAKSLRRRKSEFLGKRASERCKERERERKGQESGCVSEN